MLLQHTSYFLSRGVFVRLGICCRVCCWRFSTVFKVRFLLSCRLTFETSQRGCIHVVSFMRIHLWIQCSPVIEYDWFQKSPLSGESPKCSLKTFHFSQYREINYTLLIDIPSKSKQSLQKSHIWPDFEPGIILLRAKLQLKSFCNMRI